MHEDLICYPSLTERLPPCCRRNPGVLQNVVHMGDALQLGDDGDVQILSQLAQLSHFFIGVGAVYGNVGGAPVGVLVLQLEQDSVDLVVRQATHLGLQHLKSGQVSLQIPMDHAYGGTGVIADGQTGAIVGELHQSLRTVEQACTVTRIDENTVGGHLS